MAKEHHLLDLLARVSDRYEFDLLSKGGGATTLMSLVVSEIESIQDLEDLKDPYWEAVIGALRSTIDLSWGLYPEHTTAAEKTQLLFHHLTSRLLLLKKKL